jgi:glutamine amidotransferase
MIVIVDYRTANVGSMLNMFKKIGVPARVASNPGELDGATKLVLPGIGHFDTCAKNLKSMGFASAIPELAVEMKIPLIGICVGAQLLTRGSEEGDEAGLGLIAAETIKFSTTDFPGIKIPHMGWNLATPQLEHPIFSGFETVPRFYFVHSYYIRCDSKQNSLATTTHGVTFDSAIGAERVVGVQFHPEKSHKFGLRLLGNFASCDYPGSTAIDHA